ncbi:hypothetical protein Pst134EA_031349 [Puccinia striiformis f. sp. tritici]|uniref:uncharacterized protein n=1 Tax=Puccinia striiformis f. sp. tritici TaxID=168172 RepID=UPI0020085220|nr:uncharacterized protein Pst134EA_031349 [Puccinia striiformis f. sp. tritici]KAH9445349.1 hypothetical protein Pst134EA_031349 [Puccinia striiformis f. sp. tritici]
MSKCTSNPPTIAVPTAISYQNIPMASQPTSSSAGSQVGRRAQSDRITHRPVQLSELEDVCRLESDGFPADEAATMTTIQYRHSAAPQLFVGAYLDEQLIGFVNATCSSSETLDHDSLTHHDQREECTNPLGLRGSGSSAS